jgi:superfamily II DNA or RNA helicase
MTQLAFRINPQDSNKNKSLSLDLGEVEGSNTAMPHFQGFSKGYTEDALSLLCSVEDKRTLSMLLRSERSIRRKLNENNESFVSLRADDEIALDVLRALAKSKSLFHKGGRVMCDLLVPSKLLYLAELTDDGKAQLKGKVTLGKKEVAIQELDLLMKGEPHWFLRGFIIKIFRDELSWKWIEKVLEPMPVSKDELKELHEDFGEGDIPSAPHLQLADGFSFDAIQEKKKEILPLLKLRDRYGAYADLWIEYDGKDIVSYHDPSKSFGDEEAMWESDLLETDFIKKVVGSTHYHCPLDKVAKALSFLLELGWQMADNSGKRVVHAQYTSLEMALEGSHIKAKGEVSYGEHKASVADVIGAFNRRESFVDLGSNTVGLFPDSLQANELEILETGEIVGDAVLFNKSQLGSLAPLIESELEMRCDISLQDLQSKLNDFSGIEQHSPGSAFQGELRHYQQEGLNWLCFLQEYGFSGILADDMGLGKTVQVLAFLSTMERKKRVLIVVPTTLLFHWKGEIERFLPSHKVYVHAGPNRERNRDAWPDSDIIICSYAILRKDFSAMSQSTWDALILDEAQAIKNPDSQTAKALCKLEAEFRLCITGTPIENSLQDLWSHFKFLLPELLGERKEFMMQGVAGQSDPAFFKRIGRTVKPFLLRRLKSEVAKDLPEKSEQTVLVEMTEGQRKIYDNFLVQARGSVLKKVEEGGIAKHRMEIFEVLLRLRQICCHPLLFDGGAVQEERSSAKFRALLEDIETVVEEGNKVLVYSQFTSMLNLIEKEVQEKGWKHVRLDGSTKDREGVVKAFQEDEDVSIFLLSLKAGGIGLNLTAADYVFLYEPWWNLAVENQAIDRAHRIGRKDPVLAKRYISAESIEEKMMSLKAAKGSLANDVIGDEGSGSVLTAEDLQFLLG